jgi:hypothetical protein
MRIAVASKNIPAETRGNLGQKSWTGDKTMSREGHREEQDHSGAADGAGRRAGGRYLLQGGKPGQATYCLWKTQYAGLASELLE